MRGKYYKKFDVASCGCRPIGWTDDAAPIIEFCALHKAAKDLLRELKDFHEMNKINLGSFYEDSLMEKEVIELIARAEGK